MTDEQQSLQEHVAQVVGAYFSTGRVSLGDVAGVINQVAAGFRAISGPGTEAAQSVSPSLKLTPAQIRKSVTSTALISFEDGKAYKTLKRHLTVRGMTMAQYREKWGLASDYPAVSVQYAAHRSELAKKLGLGRQTGATPGRKKK